MIYLDNAATTCLSEKVLKTLTYWNDKYGNSASTYEIGREASAIIEQTRKSIANYMQIGDQNKIIFTSGGCEGNSTAIKSMVLNLFHGHRPINIAISGLEHHSVINAVYWACEFFDAKIIYYPLKNGRIDVDKLLVNNFFEVNKITMTSIIWGNNETGAVQSDILQLITKAKQSGVLIHVDAVQIVPRFGVDIARFVTNIFGGIDFLTFSGHKIGAPKGIGVLYCSDVNKLIPLIDGGEQEFGKRGGTLNAGLIASLGCAISELQNLKNGIVYCDYTKYFKYINDNLIIPYGLSFNNPQILQTDALDKYMGIINIDCKIESSPIVSYLDQHGICVSTGSACNGDINYSHVLEKIGCNPTTSLRVSLNHKTTIEDLERFVNTIEDYFDLVNSLKDKTTTNGNRS